MENKSVADLFAAIWTQYYSVRKIEEITADFFFLKLKKLLN